MAFSKFAHLLCREVSFCGHHFKLFSTPHGPLFRASWKGLHVSLAVSTVALAFAAQENVFLEHGETVESVPSPQKSGDRIRKWIKDNLQSNPELEDSLSTFKATFPEYFTANHVFHGVLMGYGLIEDFQVYVRKDKTGLVSVLQLGHATTGHPGIVHGGITALAFDNMMGWAAFLAGFTEAFTVNMNVQYKKPVLCDQTYIMHVTVTKIEGRKAFLNGTLENEDGTVFAEASCVYVIPKDIYENQQSIKEAAA
mmetsp:Transcript_39020/g.50453  ORF Transcript_39020/g.50453 Transcript_39020/m.50453 type:complete len:253 (+) Transcript_39020:85-843(+)